MPGLELPGADDDVTVIELPGHQAAAIPPVQHAAASRLGDPIEPSGETADIGEDAEPRTISVSARHEAVLDDGRRLSLLDGRGWAASLRGAAADGVADIWSGTSEREIAETARTVVGPDEPFGGHTQESMETSHWQTLAETLGAQGVVVDPGELRLLPHDVVLSERLRARLSPGDSG